MAFQFPWTNFHELNLDWFLSKFKQFTNNYLGTTATAESVPYNTQPSVTVTGGELDDDTDIVDPFTFNFKIPAGQPGAQGAQGVQGIPGQDGFSPIATVTKTGTTATITITDANGTTTATVSDGSATWDQINSKAPVITDTAEGAIASFPDGADDIPVQDLVVDIEPVQSGSGDPSPDNIRPITGWTGCNVTRTGKNLLDASVVNSGLLALTVGSSENSITPSTRYGYSDRIPSTKQMILSARSDDTTNFNWVRVVQYVNGVVVANLGGFEDISSTKTLAIPARENSYIRVVYGASAGGVISPSALDEVQLEGGSTATTYEPYQGNTYTVNWQTEAGTVYGGTLDVTTGVLTVTDANIASYNGETLPSTWISDRDVYASGTTPTTGAQVVYKLATPLTYNLTPQEVKTLLGQNNIWADCGDSTAEYRADTKLYIEKLTMPTEDDMTANTTITSGTFFMIGNNLYKATTTIASGSQIIPGTNATPMSLADALNSL